ncbi:hypothetical protein [Francisella hispaniensis]|uniref:Uncharacterized protein n=1 Tax=Francisella hispaniensis FSC454 TaxID=1088883 RepID=A0AAC9J5D8_9GAMM|nr:hypothetical protein [Francisella hispaniensis]APD50724.1 hypothetical protein FSC454_06185 [Francisella hispaniensis FSC454]
MNSFILINILSDILAIIYAIKISKFSKDAWLFYITSIIISSSTFFLYNNFSIINYFYSLEAEYYNIAIAVLGLIISLCLKIKTKNISEYNKVYISLFLLVIISSFVLLTIFIISEDSFTKIEITCFLLFDILGIIGLALLAIKCIQGLFFQAVYFGISAIIAIIYNAFYNHDVTLATLPVSFDIIMTIIFTNGYLRNKNRY